jgi:hypothetical protein
MAVLEYGIENAMASIRLLRVLLCEYKETWISGRKWLDIEEYRLSQEVLDEPTEVVQVA